MASSPRPSLDGLPFDILCQVCEHLSSLECNRQSLLALSLASKKCSFATARERFSCISLTIRSPARLESDMALLSKTLSDACAYTCVRRVNIVGNTEMCPDNNYGDCFNDDGDGQDEPSAPDSIEQRKECDEKTEASGWDPLEQHRFFSPHSYPTYRRRNQCYCEKPHDKDREAKVWKPLVSLLRLLPGLTDIVAEGMHLVRRSILQLLHEHKPSCRVHMNSFGLASQSCLKHQQKNITDDEYLLITSPCLYSIMTSHSVNYNGPHVDYNGEAIIAMMARYSPNLRHLWPQRTLPGGEIGLAENLNSPRPRWRGFFPDSRGQFQDANGSSSGIGQLDSLMLRGDIIALDAYMRSTDFSRLSGLHIMNRVDDNMMRELVQLGQSRGLASLKSLSLKLSCLTESQAAELACELLACVPPLGYFCFDAEAAAAERVLSALFPRHGQTLRTLCIKTAETSTESLEDLQSHCPMLRQVMIILPRKPGDEHEARIYRTLGKLSYLERLTIWLSFRPPCEEAADTHFMGSHSDEECVEYLKWDLPQFAVDSELAKSMFRIVATEQRAKIGKSSLERLCLRPLSVWNEYADASDMKGPMFSDVAYWIARSWLPRQFSDLEDVSIIRAENRGPKVRLFWTLADEKKNNWLKKPEIEDFLADELEARISHEIEVCEFIRQHPCPNLAEYYGCTESDGRVTGLCFKKYKRTLIERVNPRRLSKEHFVSSGRPLGTECMRDWLKSVRMALEYLHHLQLVHNDITPANIMLDNNDMPVIIDFGGLCSIGESLQHTKRTMGWHDETVAYARPSNDMNAVAELEAWLFGSAENFQFS